MANVILDTGPLVALFKRNDHHHARAVAWFRSNTHRLVTTLPVLTEAWHLVSPPAQVKLVEFAARAIGAADLGDDAVERIARLVARYRDAPMDFADASLVVLAELIGTDAIATIDRGFAAFRIGARRRRFRLVFD